MRDTIDNNEQEEAKEVLKNLEEVAKEVFRSFEEEKQESRKVGDQ